MIARRSLALGTAPSRRPLPFSPAGAVRPAGLATVLYVPPSGVAQGALARPAVAMYQQVLIALGYTDNGRMRVDGVLGPSTARAVHAFQTDMQPARVRVETGEFGDRVREFLAATAPLAIDSNLGPETQRWLQWFALPADQGGAGGEGADYWHVPVAAGVTGLVPARVTRSGGRTIAPEVAVGASAPTTLALYGTTPLVTLAPPATTLPAPPPATTPSAPAPGATALPANTTASATPPPAPWTPAPIPGTTAAPPQALTTAGAASGSSQALLAVGVAALVGLGAWALSNSARRPRRAGRAAG